jgi:hypothetical protein
VQSIRVFGLSTEQYKSQRSWETASLEVCPFAAAGGCELGWDLGGGSCRLRRHGSYERSGGGIARFLCMSAHRTISLLPDFMAAGATGSLQGIEDAADRVERHVGSLEQLAEEQRPMADDDPDTVRVAGAVKWLRRRRSWVAAVLVVARQLLPERLAGCVLTLAAFRAALGVTQVLVTLRQLLAARLGDVPAPIGLKAGPTPRNKGPQRTGLDPP